MDLLAASDFLVVVGKVFSFAFSVLLIILVLLQKEKGGGLAGAFGGSGSISTFGVKTSDVAARITWWLFSIWLVISLSLAVMTKRGTEEKPETPSQSIEKTEKDSQDS